MVVKACSMENESMEVTFVDKFCSHEISTLSKSLTDEEPVEIQPLKFEDPIGMEKEEETKKCEQKEEKVKPKSDDGEEPTKQESKTRKVNLVGDGNDESNHLPKFMDFLIEEKRNGKEEEEEEEEDVALRSYGSMRKEKEWRRTLACKLFEERHNADVGQGMDQLWETYESETEKKHTEEEAYKKKTKKMMKTKSIEKKKKKEIVMEEEEDEDGIDHQKLCCLQALKFSTGKMHMGIARPNLLKKAFKGIGRFYNANKHPKKA